MTESMKGTDFLGKSGKKSTSRKTKSGRMAQPTKGETLVKGVVMGLIISNANQLSKSLFHALTRHPLAIFSTGFVTGYLTHKYRKEIIVLGSRTADESKNFVLRQKENLLDFVAECEEHAKDRDKSL